MDIMVKEKIIIAILMFCPLFLLSQTYSVPVGGTQYLAVPDVYPGYVSHTVWACPSPSIQFESMDDVGATIRVISAFSGTATVQLVYVQTYWGPYSGHEEHITHYHEYYIVCNVINPTSVSLPATLNLTVGSIYQLVPQLTPVNATTTFWWSVNPTMNGVGISGDGTVYAAEVGTATVTVTTDNNLSASCVVTVVDPEEPVSVSLPEIQTVGLGETITLTPVVSPPNANTTFTWFTDDASVAFVSQGEVTGLQIGTANITVRTTNNLEAHCIIRVINVVDEESIQEACSTGVNALYRIRQYLNRNTTLDNGQNSQNAKTRENIPIEWSTNWGITQNEVISIGSTYDIIDNTDTVVAFAATSHSRDTLMMYLFESDSLYCTSLLVSSGVSGYEQLASDLLEGYYFMETQNEFSVYMNENQTTLAVFKIENAELAISWVALPQLGVDTIVSYTGIISGHEYVDLGLSVKWATCNIGADAPESIGYYFQNGETHPENSGFFVWATYDYWTDLNGDGYVEDNEIDILVPDISGSIYDAARAMWSELWRMPTKNEIQELINNCQFESVVEGGNDCFRVTGPNGQSIIFPASGYKSASGTTSSSTRAYIWSSTRHQLYEDEAYTGVIQVNSSIGNMTKCKGLIIRPVSEYIVHNYTIATSSNPANGGTVSGGGSYQEGDTCTLTAMANEGYTFVNWSKDGVVVSTTSTYNFVVTEVGVYTANFAETNSYYTVTTTADPTMAGTVSGGGNYCSGQTCTVVASPANGYSFLNWTENDSIVSTDVSYSFIVTNNSALVAHFYELPTAPTGAIQGIFSVSDNQQVWFSQGNLQYVGSSQTWRFASNQWTIVGTSQGNSSQTTTRDLFGWGTSGWDCGNTYYRPWDVASSEHNIDIASQYGPPGIYNLTESYAHSDWGVHNTISNTTGQWRTMTKEEWDYVLFTRNTPSGIRYALARVNNVRGVILLPDDWSESTYHLNNPNPTGSSNFFSNNVISASQWSVLQNAGAVFLPVTLERHGTSIGEGSTDVNGFYWTSSTTSNQYCAFVIGVCEWMGQAFVNHSASISRDTGCSVRLVCSVPSYFFDINASSNPVEGGTVSGTGSYFTGTSCTLTAMPNEGYNFANWTRDGQVVSTSASYTFTVSEDASFVANFIDASSTIQYLDFAEGWNWFSCNIDLNGLDGLSLLEQGLGNNGSIIKSQNDFIINYEGLWMGSLNSIDNMSTYMVNVNSSCSVNLIGPATNPSAAPITLDNGWTWIGYPVTVSMSIDDALTDLSPSEGDILKSLDLFSVYYSGWIGSLNTLTPGMGLMYQSNNSQGVSFTFPNGSRDGVPLANPIIEDSPWVPDIHAYPNNMTIMAVVELNGSELQADHYELAAFDGNGICRGCIRMSLVEPIDRYVAFLAIAGEEDVDLRFGLRDSNTGETCLFAEETLPFEVDAIIGNLDMPLVLHFRGMNGVDEYENDVYAYPNPVEHGQCFSIGYTASIQTPMKIEIINALGATVAVQTFDKMPSAIVAPNVPGIYIIHITVDGKERLIHKLVVK